MFTRMLSTKTSITVLSLVSLRPRAVRLDDSPRSGRRERYCTPGPEGGKACRARSEGATRRRFAPPVQYGGARSGSIVRRRDLGASATTGSAGGVSTVVPLEVVVTATGGGASDGSYGGGAGVATSAV